MKIVNVRKILLDPPSERLFTAFFDCEEKGVKFLMVSKCILSDFRLQSWDIQLFWGNPSKSIQGYALLKERGCLTRISPTNRVDSILKDMKDKIEEKKRRMKTVEKGPPASPEEVSSILNKFRNQMSENYGNNWYEKSKSQDI